MKHSIFLLMMLFSISSFAQTTAHWKGGTPGKKNCWHEAKNWSDNRVPDEFTYVVIEALNTGHHALPVISQEIEVGGIDIYGGASLTIKNTGSVTIDGSDFYTEGITNTGGKIYNHGVIHLYQVEGFSYFEMEEILLGKGHIVLDGITLNSKSMAHE